MLQSAIKLLLGWRNKKTWTLSCGAKLIALYDCEGNNELERLVIVPHQSTLQGEEIKVSEHQEIVTCEI